ncbi:hypothetical protein [Nonomuraea guangzhouensis]|uniref:Uncharacterized protein n=1 Tax=Nonomuraea guangzhouensis TaxID=1291555 RepID=A0ABW4GGN8_9ACTN|nr:hypothetical protein [Nonomuraea guangzhouensis]
MTGQFEPPKQIIRWGSPVQEQSQEGGALNKSPTTVKKFTRSQPATSCVGQAQTKDELLPESLLDQVFTGVPEDQARNVLAAVGARLALKESAQGVVLELVYEALRSSVSQSERVRILIMELLRQEPELKGRCLEILEFNRSHEYEMILAELDRVYPGLRQIWLS